MSDQTDGDDPVKRAQALSRPELPKRFFKEVSIAGREEGNVILLDGRVLRTPKKNIVAVADASLARALADEWDSQEEFLDPTAMPLTRIVNAGLDVVEAHRDPIIDELSRFLGSDLLCYRADRPETLVRRQMESWDPVLRWAEDTLAMRFMLVEGLMPVEQPPETIEAGKTVFAEADDITLAGLHTTTTLLGSAVLAIAHWHAHLTTEEAWKAAHVDEDWNFETWGEDQDAMTRRALRREEMAAAAIVVRKGAE